MPVQHISDMDTINGNAPALDQYNRISSLAATLRTSSKAANYTVKVEESGTCFIATAAVTFTLPTLAAAMAGCFYFFFNAADSNMTIASDPADKMVADGDAAADSIAFSTAAHKIGGALLVVTDGSLWYTFAAGNLSAIPTVAT